MTPRRTRAAARSARSSSNLFSSDDETIAPGDFSKEHAAEIADALRAAGFRVEVALGHSCSAYRPADSESRITPIDTHSIDEMPRSADEMVAAGESNPLHADWTRGGASAAPDAAAAGDGRTE